MRGIRRLLAVAFVTVLAAAGIGLAADPAAASDYKMYTWNTLTRGDCTMFSGAHWVVYPSGAAYFHATITSSDDNDAWLMRAHLADGNGYDLLTLQNWTVQDREDWTMFIYNMADHRRQYEWYAEARFDKNVYPRVGRMYLYLSC